MFLKYNDIHTVVPQSTDDAVVTIKLYGNIAHLFGNGHKKSNNAPLLSMLCLSDDLSIPYQTTGYEEDNVHLVLDQEDSDRVVKLFDLYLEAKQALTVFKRYRDRDLIAPWSLRQQLENQYRKSRTELVDRYNILPSAAVKYGTFNEFSDEEKEDAS